MVNVEPKCPYGAYAVVIYENMCDKAFIASLEARNSREPMSNILKEVGCPIYTKKEPNGDKCPNLEKMKLS